MWLGLKSNPVWSGQLHADYLAGVWASLNNKVKSRLEPGDIEEALQAASAIGDDNLPPDAGQGGAGILHSRHLDATRALVPQGR
jgi:Putative neutral zinc metallopeptidase